jgi:DNA-binding response OmpR family regulator
MGWPSRSPGVPLRCLFTVYVHRLRKQLSDKGANVSIKTVRGMGYLLTNEQ